MGVCTSQKQQKEQTFEKGFLWGDSDGVDHVAIKVLQHDVPIGAPLQQTADYAI